MTDTTGEIIQFPERQETTQFQNEDVLNFHEGRGDLISLDEVRARRAADEAKLAGIRQHIEEIHAPLTELEIVKTVSSQIISNRADEIELSQGVGSVVSFAEGKSRRDTKILLPQSADNIVSFEAEKARRDGMERAA